MNKIKKSLIENAGDMNESKERVRKRLYEHQVKSEHTKKNIFAGLGAVAMIGLLFLVTTFLLNHQTDNTQLSTSNLFDDQLFEFQLKLDKAIGFNDFRDDEARLEYVYRDYERDLAIYTFALSLGYEITETEINAAYEKHTDWTEEAKKSWQELLSETDVTLDEFQEHLYKTMPYIVAEQHLEKHYIEMYPRINFLVASSLAEKHAIPYFREHYANDIQIFKEKHGLPLYNKPIWEGNKKLGRVVAFKDNMFLVVSNATIEDIQTLQVDEILNKYPEAYWYPQDEIPNLSVGDLIEVYGKMIESDSSPFVSDIWRVKMIDDYDPSSKSSNTKSLTIEMDNVGKVKSFVSMLNWEETEIDFTRSATYLFEVNNINYQIWSYPDGFVLYSSKNEYRKLNEDFTKELAEYLGISPGLN